MLVDLNVQPGIVKEDTDYASEGRYISGNLVRFRDGRPENVRGWQSLGLTLSGVARAVQSWRDLSGFRNAIFGTTQGLEVMQGGALTDVTPVRKTTTSSNLFATVASSATVTLSDVAHGATVGDTIVVSSASATVGGLDLEGSHTVVSVPTANTLTFTASSAATSTDSGPGTATVEYLLNISSVSATAGLGWGAGPWGEGTWGTARASTTVTLEPGQWSFGLWGEDVLACPRQGGIYLWDASAGTSTRAALASAQAPTRNRLIIVAEASRFVIALGTEVTLGDTSSYDPLLVRWCHQENYQIWTPSSTNTAGFQRLSGGTKIITAVTSRRETIILTDEDVWRMRLVTSNDVFQFERLGKSCGAIGQQSAIDVNGIVYWMGKCNFYVWDGTIRPLNCPMHSDIFENMALAQGDKFFVAHNRAETELMWFWQDSTGSEINRLNVYNYVTGTWWEASTLHRTTWLDNATFTSPIATGTDGKIYYQDTGNSADGQAMNCWLESSDVSMEAGEAIIFSRRMIPDVTLTSGTLDLTLKVVNYHSTEEVVVEKGPFTLTGATKQINPRLRGRHIRIRYESNAADARWRVGQPRLDVQADGGQ